jgi:hypothetical protein
MGNSFNIPHFISAESPERLRALMLENNVKMKAECQYFQIVFDGQRWIAWYYKEADEKGFLLKKKVN